MARSTLALPMNHRMSRWLARLSDTVLPATFVSRMRESREWKAWVDKLEPNALVDLTGAPDDVKRALFKKFVSLVEIEVHARCNRVCSFCPNAIVDRRRNRTVADADMLDRLFDQLGSIDYRGQIKVARYSEPLTNRPFLYDRIRSARTKVPHACLAIVTNTDYLTPVVLEELRSAGLDRVYMSIYFRANEAWSLDLANEYSRRLSEKLAVPISARTETSVSVRCTFDYEGLELHSACIDFSGFGTDRGNLMKQYTQENRVGPCREPFESFVVDYTGKVMPCCNLRSDFTEHYDLAVGDLLNEDLSIFDIYAGRLAAWRKSMLGFDVKESPCTTCTHRDLSGPSVTPVSLHLRRKVSTFPAVHQAS
jgi:MoaA/NifB/PqqE/SkfB family radical SAM enzyme